MLTSALHRHPVAASPCSTSSSSLGFLGSMSDLLNSSFGESSSSSVRSSPKRQHNHLHKSNANDNQQTMPRVRTIRLKRPTTTTTTCAAPPQHLQSRNLLIGGGNAVNSMELSLIANQSNSLFGFSIRGGSEYRTGFYVSHVEPSGEADSQGIQVGDQIIRVNNHPVDDATHKELSQYIANQSHLTLRVRNIGMIPVKERDMDPLTWQMVHQDPKSSSSSEYDDVQCRDIVVTLSLAPKEKLGLGICKGPEWKPGIFVQFTKDHGIARRAGLKPGDHILSCNGVEFDNILFNDAVSVMKSSSHLELSIRTAVGLELFPGESSGYNSSASSVTGGDQSPCWNESGICRRYDVEGRMNPTKSPFKPQSTSGRDRLMAVTTPKVPQLISFQNLPSQNLTKANITETYNAAQMGDLQNTTIIKLSEDGTMINNTLIPHVTSGPLRPTATTTRTNTTLVHVESVGNGHDNCGLSKEQHGNLFAPQETAVVQVHREDATHNRNSVPPPPPPFFKLQPPSTKTEAIASPRVANSIADEIQKRAEAMQTNKQSSIDDRIQMKAKSSGYNTEQHCQLMDEFKKAHQKMFLNNMERQRAQQLRNNEVDRDLPDRVVQVASVLTAPAVYSTSSTTTDATSKYPLTTKIHGLTHGKAPPSPPPSKPRITDIIARVEDSPPPPIEFADDVTKAVLSSTVKPTAAHSHPGRIIGNGYKGEKPITPTPDYDSLSCASSSEDQMIQSGAIPVPPPQQQLSLGLRTTRKPAPPKPNRSISVTIGEYGRNNDAKREPAKLGFLSHNADKLNGHSRNTSEMLQNELQMTLSRSNLMKSGDPDKVPLEVLSKSIHNANGKPKAVLETTGAANVERITSMLNARNQLITKNTSNSRDASTNNGSDIGQVNPGPTKKVTITIPKSKSAIEPEVKISPNGILKTANGISVNPHTTTAQANGEAKNIKFDNITTVIGIRK